MDNKEKPEGVVCTKCGQRQLREKKTRVKKKKAIGEVFGYGLERNEKINEDELGILTEVERLIRQGVDVFTEIDYNTIVFYYFTEEKIDGADTRLGKKSPNN